MNVIHDYADQTVVLGFCASQLVHKQLLAVWKNGQTASAKPQEGVPTQITEDGWIVSQS